MSSRLGRAYFYIIYSTLLDLEFENVFSNYFDMHMDASFMISFRNSFDISHPG